MDLGQGRFLAGPESTCGSTIVMDPDTGQRRKISLNIDQNRG
jgi:hypothetical protein